MKALVLAAPTSGAGKTIVTLGLLRALSRYGHRVAAAKSGPDYIDPAFHSRATGRPSRNLDAWAMPGPVLRGLADAAAADLLVVEGAVGAVDGAGREAAGSAADLAVALGAPLLLVLDAARAGASAVLPALGLRVLRPELRLMGVIFNRVASDRHHALLAAAAQRAGIRVFGQIRRDPALSVPERHLGLVQAEEITGLDALIARAADSVSAGVDLAGVLAAMEPLPHHKAAPVDGLGWMTGLPPPSTRKVAVAQDRAFRFAYPHLGWGTAPQDQVFSPLADEAPDSDADVILLPGGYPELHAKPLAEATLFRRGMLAAARRGARIYGECGGYMVLGRTLRDAEGTAHRMLDLLPVETSFAKRRLTLGYRTLRPADGAPVSAVLRGHEFHYATLAEPEREAETDARLFEAEDADGRRLAPLGHVRGNTAGSFAHVIWPHAPLDEGDEGHAASGDKKKRGEGSNSKHGGLS